MQAAVEKVAEREECIRRITRRVTARAWKAVRDGVGKVGLENPEMAPLLIHHPRQSLRRGWKQTSWRQL